MLQFWDSKIIIFFFFRKVRRILWKKFSWSWQVSVIAESYIRVKRWDDGSYFFEESFVVSWKNKQESEEYKEFSKININFETSFIIRTFIQKNHWVNSFKDKFKEILICFIFWTIIITNFLKICLIHIKIWFLRLVNSCMLNFSNSLNLLICF